MPSIATSNLSTYNMRTDTRKTAKAFNAAWGAAAKSPLFLRRAKYVGSGKEKRLATITVNGITKPAPRRSNKCLSGHSLKILLSAAIHDANETLAAEGKAMGIDISGEMMRAPALYTISKGASLMMEHALSSYTQSIFDAATRIVDNEGKHQKVTPGSMRAAVEIVNTSLARASSMIPYVHHVNKYSRPVRSSVRSSESKRAAKKAAKKSAAEAAEADGA